MKRKLAMCLAAVAGTTCAASAQSVMISEIMTNPASIQNNTAEPFDNQVEYVEIYNYGAVAVDISGWTLQDEDGPAGTFPAATPLLAAGEVILCIPGPRAAPPVCCAFGQTEADFRGGWPSTPASVRFFIMNSWNDAAPNGLQSFSSSPSATNEILQLVDAGLNLVDEVNWDDAAPWPPDSPAGPSIYVAPAFMNNGANDAGGSWARSTAGTDFAVVVVVGGDYSAGDVGSPGRVAITNDCNGNFIADCTEINANGGVGCLGGSLDCNGNGVIDSCELNSATDCDGDLTLDFCQINNNGGAGGAGGTLDCDADGRIDTCEIAQFPDMDSCFGGPNGILDNCELVSDCDGDGTDDCVEFKFNAATDVNGNSLQDSCEGAIVVECLRNMQIRDTGPTENTGFYNVEGANYGSFADYGLLRWTFSPGGIDLGGGAQIREVYLYLQQANASFTVGSTSSADPANVEIFHTDEDATVFTSPGSTLTFSTFDTDWGDETSVTDYTFVRGVNNPPLLPGAGTDSGSGEIEVYKLFDRAGPNTPGGDNINLDMTDLNDYANDQFTLLMKGIPDIAFGDFVAATYGGRSHSLYRGPTLVVFAACDGIDFNRDGVWPDSQDLFDFLDVFGGAACPSANCGDLDFNNDLLFPDIVDLFLFLDAFGGAVCP